MVFIIGLKAYLEMIRLIQSVVPHMASKKKGKIVNVESCIALDLGPWSGAYSASKADVHSFTDTLRYAIANFVLDGFSTSNCSQAYND